MCRLLAYVHSGSPRSMRESLGDRVIDEFRQLGEVHRDGWGAVWAGSRALSSYVSNNPASQDAVFGTLIEQALGSTIVHERLASPGIGLSLDNQQPFISGGLAFAHNGTISNAEGNVVQRPAAYREDLGLVHSTTMSDSRIYADLFFLRLGELRQSPQNPPTVEEVLQALTLTIARLRRDYPDASFNNVIETAGFTFATRAHPDEPRVSEGLRRIYDKADWSHRIESYYELGYTTLRHADGSVTSAASSSGYAASDAWVRLENNTVAVLSHADGSVRTLSLRTSVKS